jgi:hypothetical protein
LGDDSRLTPNSRTTSWRCALAIGLGIATFFPGYATLVSYPLAGVPEDFSGGRNACFAMFAMLYLM